MTTGAVTLTSFDLMIVAQMMFIEGSLPLINDLAMHALHPDLGSDNGTTSGNICTGKQASKQDTHLTATFSR